MPANSTHSHLALFTVLVFGLAPFHALNQLRKSSMLSATTRKAIETAHSKFSHNWRDLNSIPFMYLRLFVIFISRSLSWRCKPYKRGLLRLWGTTMGYHTFNGNIARCKRFLLSIPVTRRARFMPRKFCMICVFFAYHAKTWNK